jgi:cardiolipin synthase A/B
MARPPYKLKKDKLTEGVGELRTLEDVGIEVRKLKHLKLHGKMLFADGIRMIVGSINLAPGSFDNRRELAIEVRDDEPVERMAKIAHHDWKHSHPLDLTDEGLQARLKEDGVDAENELAFKSDHKKHKERDG